MRIHTKILSTAALVAAAISPSFAQTATTKPVGYRTETVKAGVFNLLSPNLDNKIGAAGTIDAVNGQTLTDNDVDFTTAFAAGDQLILTVTGGANAGLVQDITGFTQNTLTTAQNVSSLITAGTTYEVRKVQTVAELFGASNSAGLQGGNASTADIVWVSDGTGGYVRVYYSTGGLFGTGWRRVGGGGADAANVAVPFTDSFFIERRGSTDLNLTFVGHVRTQPAKTVAEAGIFNLMSRLIPVGVTLGQTNLSNELNQGNASTADIVWNPDGNGGYTRYYFSNGGLFGTGWRRVGGGGTDAANEVLMSGYLIERRGTAPATVTLAIPPGLDL